MDCSQFLTHTLSLHVFSRRHLQQLGGIIISLLQAPEGHTQNSPRHLMRGEQRPRTEATHHTGLGIEENPGEVEIRFDRFVEACES